MSLPGSGDDQTRILGQGRPKAAAPRRIDKYEITGKLGEGGMGSVLMARDPDLERLVAIKVLRPELSRDEKFLSRFVREAKLTASLNHPNIVSVYGTGRHDDQPFIVMEFVEGRTLKDLCKATPPPQILDLLRIYAQCCDGLEAAATRNIVHRDVKPANIMVRPDGTAKLMDFGLSKIEHSEGLTATNMVLGTPEYMAPEQSAGRPTDFRTDIYSLGVSLFHSVAGYAPFGAGSVVELIRRHAQDPLPPDEALLAIDNGRLFRLIQWMSAKDPAQRPPSYAAIRRELETIATNLRNAGQESTRARMPVSPSGSGSSDAPKAYNFLPPADPHTPASKAKSGSGSRPASGARSSAIRRRNRQTLMIVVGAIVVLLLTVLGALLATGELKLPRLSGSRSGAVPTPSASPTPPPTAAPAAEEPELLTLASNAWDREPNDLLIAIKSKGVNLHVQGETRRDFRLRYNVNGKAPVAVLRAAALACGWQLDHDSRLDIHKLQPDPRSAADRFKAAREAAFTSARRAVTVNTIPSPETSPSVSLAQLLEQIRSEGLDYIAVGAEPGRPLPELSFTKRPVGDLFDYLIAQGVPVDWAVVDGILVIRSGGSGNQP